ncbi:unnamed protein product [Arctogadus glacialis]
MYLSIWCNHWTNGSHCLADPTHQRTPAGGEGQSGEDIFQVAFLAVCVSEFEEEEGTCYPHGQAKTNAQAGRGCILKCLT